MLEALLIVISVFLGCGISLFAGYRIGQKTQRPYLLPLEEKDKNVSLGGTKNHEEYLKLMKKEQIEANPNAEKLSKKDDIINHEGVGIIYRPSAQEIEKMNEPESERQAKEAIAETIRNTPAPEI